MFCGVYLEATLHLLIGRKLGLDECKRLDWEPYETKLKALGCGDQDIIKDAARLRSTGKDLVHEKAMLVKDDLKQHKMAEFRSN